MESKLLSSQHSQAETLGWLHHAVGNVFSFFSFVRATDDGQNGGAKYRIILERKPVTLETGTEVHLSADQQGEKVNQSSEGTVKSKRLCVLKAPSQIPDLKSKQSVARQKSHLYFSVLG